MATLTVTTNESESHLPENEPVKATDATTMKAVVVKDFVSEVAKDVGDVVSFTLVQIPNLSNKQGSKDMIVRVLACSLSPGDAMMMNGTLLRRAELPFIPGMDIAGIVEEIDNGVTEFKVGDTVVANNGVFPVGGMAEYMLVDARNAVLKPDSVDALNAAAFSSAVTSLDAAHRVRVGDRVLVLRGDGGVGTSAIALAKRSGASFIAVTVASSTDESRKLCKSLGADIVIGDTEIDWWEIKEYQGEKFDKLIDTVGGDGSFENATKVLQTSADGGRYISAVEGVPQHDEFAWLEAINKCVGVRLPFIRLKAILRIGKIPLELWCMIRRRTLPEYVALAPHEDARSISKVLELMDGGMLNVVLDSSSPFPFTEDGVEKAFKALGSREAHGNIVVKIGA